MAFKSIYIIQHNISFKPINIDMLITKLQEKQSPTGEL